jgi:hypothetical protein
MKTDQDWGHGVNTYNQLEQQLMVKDATIATVIMIKIMSAI